ncbi:hypothetical protein [Streptomyces cavernicola]|uniref:Lipoprotein n=1 Tax=Streptomyces cavernicola TaxID=3043613 RepID=A0ABT6SHU7_9ACTN|nr:hypothetical protein [Streptomyces sp. B-S-A6]MDI3407772.1 hypothetical protein [Streptomyces sp. B-S-A6]
MTSSSLGRARRIASVGALCAGLVVGTTGLVGCGAEKDPDAGTNGVGKLSAAKIQRKAETAAKGADSVRLAGSVVSKGATYKLDMKLTEDGGSGEVRFKNRTFELLRVDGQLFLKADADFWASQGDSSQGGRGEQQPDSADELAADKLDGKYVKVPEGDPAYKQLSGFTDKELLLDGLLTLHGKLSTGARGSADGKRTIEVSGDKGAGGTLHVSLEGTAYPLRLERAGGAGTLRLTDWETDFEFSKPDARQVVDYGKQLPTS